ncbi:transketolase family protein [Roseimaritima sediminicola]|uniref:transketolase family protein n=1 Tax=Roseimaritima sediminicola TaxID=2662066 RepID=UPI001298243E|nr:transketolase C-terminal domain-containing protein [Roseimaritima sediminicola]
MRDEFIRTLTTMAQADDSIVLITGDLGFGVLTEFAERFPKQFINAGVAEQNMTGIAAGMALEGYKVYTYSIANFVFMRCLEQIRNDAAYHDANVNVVSVGGGFSYGALGISHHATEDLAIMRSQPNVSVFCPSDLDETRWVTEVSAKTKGVSYLRLDKSKADDAAPLGPLAVGQARPRSSGRDITFVTAGGILQDVCIAADRLRSDGYDVGVISMPTIKPFDHSTIQKLAGECRAVITVEEHNVVGGLGSAVAESLMASPRRPEIFRSIGLQDQFSSVVGSQAYLRTHYGIDAQGIYEKTRQAVVKSPAIAA